MGPGLVAFAVEAPGRIRVEARAWISLQARVLPQGTQLRTRARAYKVVAVAVAIEVARQLLTVTTQP
eukprot:6071264-Prorocentrum_lima.AAC.1